MASASYVTGASSMKIGYQGGYLVENDKNFTNNTNLAYRFNNGVPNQITETITPFDVKQRVRYDSIYAQEQWTMGRVTLQGAVRYDRAYSWFPEVTVGPTIFLANAVTYPETQGVHSYNDITPRVGVAWDVFGTGKTSIKVNYGQYLQAAQNGLTYGALRPTSRLTTTVTRTWTDANRDYVPDCNLQTADRQRRVRGDQHDELRQGCVHQRPVTETGERLGRAPGDGQFGVSVQQQMLPRVSVEVGYNRRWLTNFNNVDNMTNVASDFTQFSVPAPSDPRLPGGGGYVISGLYNINPNVATLQNNVTALASDYGSETNTFNGMLLNVSARPRNGLVFQGGVSTGKTNMDYCAVRALLPEALNISRRTLTGVDRPLLQLDDRLDHALHRPWLLHAAEGRCPDLRDVPKRSRRSARGELGGVERRHPAVARPAALERRDQRDDQSDRAWHDVRRPGQRG